MRMLSRRGHANGEPHHRVRWELPVPALLTAIALLLLADTARANFVYWANSGQSTIGRAKLNGSGLNNAFISGLSNVHGVAVDSKFIYWTQGNGATSSIGRANLDGSGVNPAFIPSSAGLDFAAAAPQAAVAVTASGIYWGNTTASTVGRANIDGSAPNGALVTPGSGAVCGVAASQGFVYWLDPTLGARIGRAGADGSGPDPNFVNAVAGSCGLALDDSFLYYGATGSAVGRAPAGGGTANNAFIPSAVPAANTVCGVAVNSQYAFWANSGATDFIGRANLNGTSPNPGFLAGPTDPCLPAAAPSNKVTINSVVRKKKKGTAAIKAKVPGPGQVTLTDTGTEDVNATAANVKQVGLTIAQASSFTLPVKPQGKTAKKLKKQLKKKRKAKVGVKVYVTFVPAGVAGVPNSKPVKLTLLKQRKKGKKTKK